MNRAERNIYIFLFTMLWIYLWLRAYYVPLVHDEIATFYHYIQTGRFLPYLSHWDANNHFLNSGLSWISYTVFGLSEWSLRLPNLLAVPLLFWSVLRIAALLKNAWLRVAWISTLCFNHFFIEYLALSRGYGMSMALLITAIWLTIQLVKTNALRYYVLQSVTLLLILLSNLTLIYSAIILLLISLLIIIIQNQNRLRSFFIRLVIVLTAGFIPLALAIRYLFELKSKNLLYYGIEGGFWKVTAETLITLSTGWSFGLISGVVLMLLLLLAFFLIKGLAQSKTIQQILGPKYIFHYLLFGNMALFIAMHHLLEVKYPEDRVGMFFIPFFAGSLLFGVDAFCAKPKYKWLIYTPLILLMIPFNFIRSVNITHTAYWVELGLPQRFYDKINSETLPGQLPPIVGAHWLRSYFWAIQNYRDQGKLNLLHHATISELTDDYLIYHRDENPVWQTLYDSIDYDPMRNIHLLKRKQRANREWLYGSERFEPADTIHTTYYLLSENRIDTLAGDDLVFEWNLWLESPATPFRGSIVLDITRQDGKQLIYTVYELFHQRPAWTHASGKARNCIKVSSLPADAYRYKLYLWNQEEQPFVIKDAFINVFRLE